MAGQITTNAIQLGNSTTATQNFVWQTNVDGTSKMSRGNVGATTQDILSVDATGLVTMTQGKQLTLGTVQTTTSGTSIDFIGIPSWVKRVTVMFAGLSTSGASDYIVRIGDTNTVSATGYLGAYAVNSAASTSTTGFGISNGSSSAATLMHGTMVLTLLDPATFKWTCTAVLGESDSARMSYTGGSKILTALLTNVRLTTINGTDTFRVGSVNIMYEG